MARTLLTSVAVLALCAVATTGCRRSEPPVPPSAAPSEAVSEAIVTEQVPQDVMRADSAESPQTREEMPRIRTAIREFITEAYPKSEVDGIWVLQLRGNYCIAGADTVVNARRRNIDVLARQYVREDGSSYWRCEGFGPNTASLLLSRTTNADSPDSGS